eukprot:6207010-Lingulodinium_polyedra.AAC.1
MGHMVQKHWHVGGFSARRIFCTSVSANDFVGLVSASAPWSASASMYFLDLIDGVQAWIRVQS